MNLIHENRVKISYDNEKVFGHEGHREQIHNEVYNWLDQHAGPIPGAGVRWAIRAYTEPPAEFKASDLARVQLTRFRNGKQVRSGGSYFYFQDRSIAVLFKLAWGGE